MTVRWKKDGIVERSRDLFRYIRMKGGFASGLEVEGTLRVREPVVLDVVCKPLQ